MEFPYAYKHPSYRLKEDNENETDNVNNNEINTTTLAPPDVNGTTREPDDELTTTIIVENDTTTTKSAATATDTTTTKPKKQTSTTGERMTTSSAYTKVMTGKVFFACLSIFLCLTQLCQLISNVVVSKMMPKFKLFVK